MATQHEVQIDMSEDIKAVKDAQDLDYPEPALAHAMGVEIRTMVASNHKVSERLHMAYKITLVLAGLQILLWVVALI